jgi:hypothetical protein
MSWSNRPPASAWSPPRCPGRVSAREGPSRDGPAEISAIWPRAARTAGVPASVVLACWPKACSSKRMDEDVQLPAWWVYPVRCQHGHEWGPGRVLVGWSPCDCAPARAERTRGSGHLTVRCRSGGCTSVWYRPRHDAASGSWGAAAARPRALAGPQCAAVIPQPGGRRVRAGGAGRGPGAWHRRPAAGAERPGTNM